MLCSGLRRTLYFVLCTLGSGLTWCVLLLSRSPFIDRKIADQQILCQDWTEIKLDQPLKPVGDVQEVGLCLAKPLELDLIGPFRSSSRRRLISRAGSGIAHIRRSHGAIEVVWLTRKNYHDLSLER
jgi:hypothetical protein